jgi:hypothetical protein
LSQLASTFWSFQGSYQVGYIKFGQPSKCSKCSGAHRCTDCLLRFARTRAFQALLLGRLHIYGRVPARGTAYLSRCRPRTTACGACWALSCRHPASARASSVECVPKAAWCSTRTISSLHTRQPRHSTRHDHTAHARTLSSHQLLYASASARLCTKATTTT